MEVQQNSCMPVCVKNNQIVVVLRVPWGTRALCEAIIDAINNWDGEKTCTMSLKLQTERAQNEIEALGIPRERGQNVKKSLAKKFTHNNSRYSRDFFTANAIMDWKCSTHDQHIMLTR